MRKKELLLPVDVLDSEHIFYADLEGVVGDASGVKVSNVLCALKPLDVEGERKFYFMTTAVQSRKLMHVRAVSLRGKTRQRANSYEISAEEVWLSRPQFGSRDGISYIAQLSGKPTELEISLRPISSKAAFISHASFELTEARNLNVGATSMMSYTGNVQMSGHLRPTFTLAKGIRIRFAKHYAFEAHERGTLMRSYLSVELKLAASVKIANLRQVESKVNLFLDLLSFSNRLRCVCKSWSHSGEKYGFVKHEYHNRAIPLGDNRRDPLIDVAFSDEFLKHSYPLYRDAANRDLLQKAMQSLVSDPSFLEDEILRFFSGVQALLWFVFRQSGRTETRVPIKKLYGFFVSEYPCEFDDLWPLFTEDGNGPTLYDVRNLIAHGESISPSKMSALASARQALRQTLERMILLTLGWPLEKSMVKPNSFYSWLGNEWPHLRKDW